MAFQWEHYRKATKATETLGLAVGQGKLTRPETCELCGRTPKPVLVRLKSGKTIERPSIVGHHWQGYDQPLNVLWVCHRCNARLAGPEFHNGSMTKEQSREYVLNFVPKFQKSDSPPVRCKKCYSWAKRGGEYCYHHQPKSEP